MESLGFHVIPVKWDKETESGHTLMYKKHIMKTGVSKTLFVTNVPCYCTEVRLKSFNVCENRCITADKAFSCKFPSQSSPQFEGYIYLPNIYIYIYIYILGR